MKHTQELILYQADVFKSIILQMVFCGSVNVISTEKICYLYKPLQKLTTAAFLCEGENVCQQPPYKPAVKRFIYGQGFIFPQTT